MAHSPVAANGFRNDTHTQAQHYLSTRGEDTGLSFEHVILNNLASDGGLYIPEDVPRVASLETWQNHSYLELAFEIISLFVSPSEIPSADLKDIINRSYSAFRTHDITPLVHLRDNQYLLELFHGPTITFKDIALQFLGSLFEYFLQRKNEGKTGADRHHLTLFGATCGDTGSAAAYSLQDKQDVSVFILHPDSQERQQELRLTAAPNSHVHNLAIQGTYDDCQDILKSILADDDANKALNLSTVNSFNWGHILAQIVCYFHSYFALVRANPSFKLGDKLRFVVPSGDFGDVIAGYFAKRMGLPIQKLVFGTNENDVLDWFWKLGKYDKKRRFAAVAAARGLVVDTSFAQSEGVKETLSPTLDLLTCTNFERLLWFLAYEFAETAGMDEEWNKRQAGQEVSKWLRELQASDSFGPVYQDVLKFAKRDFESERVDDGQTVATIQALHRTTGQVLDPHTAIAVTAATRSSLRTGSDMCHIALATAHPARFPRAVDTALQGEATFNPESLILPSELMGQEDKGCAAIDVANDWGKIRDLVKEQVQRDLCEA
ncbi:hypothetical protein HIM_00070 [Hirsutella minnesotensis 3608]|nr:hypothetical protein HIM_00070 [Hirsutella minnesotensis 3608]